MIFWRISKHFPCVAAWVVTVKPWKIIPFQQEISIHVLLGFVNKGFFFATPAERLKFMLRQIKCHVWLCFSLTEKQRTINHMIIFNDSISAVQHSRLSPRHTCFLVSTSVKKNAETIKFLVILKEYLSKNKIYLCFKKKAMFMQVIFVFHTIFKLDFITQII